MIKRIGLAASTAVALLTGGFVEPPPAPTEADAGTALLFVSLEPRDPARSFADLSSSLTMKQWANADCKKSKDGKFLGSQGKLFARNYFEAPLQVLSGQRFIFSITTLNQSHATALFCTNLSSFTPEANHRYRIHQLTRDRGRQCAMIVIDEQTQAPPPSLVDHPVIGPCIGMG